MNDVSKVAGSKGPPHMFTVSLVFCGSVHTYTVVASNPIAAHKAALAVVAERCGKVAAMQARCVSSPVAV